MEIKKNNYKEIESEFFAREKHLNLIKKNKRADIVVYRKFIFYRYKYFLRETFLNKNPNCFKIYKRLILVELSMLDFFAIFKTTFGYVFFTFFKKGYRFLK